MSNINARLRPEAEANKVMEANLENSQMEFFYRMEKNAKARLNFYWHTVAYVLGTCFLVMCYLFSCLVIGRLYHPWFIWPALIWSIVLFSQFYQLYITKSKKDKHPTN